MLDKLLKRLLKILTSTKFYGPIIVIIVSIFIFKTVDKLINKFLVKTERIRKNVKKENTIINLIKNIIKYLIIVIDILIILEIYGVNTTSIIASLSVVGVVVGLAFQDTLKNVLAGILIIFEDRYSVGDIVLINGFTGEVINLGLSTTKLKAVTGEIFTITNSNISTVVNYSVCNTLLFLDLGVSYSTNIDSLEKVLTKLKPKLETIPNVVNKEVELLGVDSLDSSQVTYRISILCKPYTHFAIKRTALKLIKEEFDKKGIEIPFNQLDVHIKTENE